MSVTDVARLVSAFDLGTPVSEPVFITRTLSSNVYRLATERGEWAIKEHLRSPNSARCEAIFALEVAAAAVGVPLPRPVAAVETGRPLIDGMRVWTWIDLTPIPTPAPTALLGQLGAAMAKLHTLPAPEDATPFHSWYRDPPADGVWDDLLASAGAARVSWVDRFAGKISEVRELAALARAEPPVTRSGWCHFDLLPHNCGTDKNGSLVILDWDDAAVGDPSRELGSVVAAWTEPDSAAADLILAYTCAGGPGRLESLASMSIVAAFRCNYLAVVTRNALDLSIPEEIRSSSASQVEELLARPLSVATLQAYVESAQ